ncbi:MAG: hypothetical protein HYS27_07690 [Deltaproteobacteria bacterium]|nr:hypothetical protein [Deltaproteobacteria bacterium]
MEALTPLAINLVYVVPPLALLLVWGGARLEARLKRRFVTAAWVVLAVLAMTHYVWPNLRFQRYFNGYEHFHYYLGTKYARELGYTGLYVATVGALDENAADRGRPPIKIDRARDLDTGRHVSPERLRRGIPDVKERFTDERWQEFREDAAYMAERASWGGMVKALDDKGYNASPAWTLVSGALSNATSTSTGSVAWLPWIDVLLWLVAFTALGLTFGGRVVAVVLVVLGTQLVTDHAHLKFAFLRVDWIACLLVALAAQKKGRPTLAGALVGYAAMMRIFPAVFAYGVGVKLVSELVRKRKVDRGSVLFLLGMTASMAVLFVASAAVYGLPYWQEFLDKIVPHASAVTSWRIGFRYIFVGLGGLDTGQAFFDQYSTFFYLICLVLLIGCAFIAEKLEPDDALGFSFFAFYLLMAPTYYYYVALVIPTWWFAKHLEQQWAKVGLTILFVIGVAMHKLLAIYDRGSAVFVPMSVAVLIMFVYVTRALWLEQRRKPPDAAAAPAAPTTAA